MGYGQKTRFSVFSCTLRRNRVNIGKFDVDFISGFCTDYCSIILSIGDYLQ